MKHIGLFLLFIIVGFTASAQLRAMVYQDVENLKIQQADNNKAIISLDIKLYNPNHYKLRLKDGDVDVFVNGNKLGKLQMQDKLEVPKQDTFLIPALLNVDLQALLPNALQLVLSNGVADITLSGSIKAGRHGIFISIPVNYEDKQDLGALLKQQ
jgi:LEA14-like dessication related protein